MWFKQDNGNGKGRGVPSILGEGFKSKGDIVSDGEVHVLGEHSGDIAARTLTLAKGGSITGTVKAESALIDGALSGRLTAVSVALGPNAAVIADIVYVSMKMEPGAVHEGYHHRVDGIENLSADNIVKLSLPQRQDARQP